MKLHWLWCWSDEKWARTLYKWGKEDALNNIDELSSKLKSTKLYNIKIIKDNCNASNDSNSSVDTICINNVDWTISF